MQIYGINANKRCKSVDPTPATKKLSPIKKYPAQEKVKITPTI
jgi:hypothetical protein